MIGVLAKVYVLREQNIAFTTFVQNDAQFIVRTSFLKAGCSYVHATIDSSIGCIYSNRHVIMLF